MSGQPSMNDELLKNGLYKTDLYTVELINNQRIYIVKNNAGEVILRRGACWATFYEIETLLGEKDV